MAINMKVKPIDWVIFIILAGALGYFVGTHTGDKTHETEAAVIQQEEGVVADEEITPEHKGAASLPTPVEVVDQRIGNIQFHEATRLDIEALAGPVVGAQVTSKFFELFTGDTDLIKEYINPQKVGKFVGGTYEGWDLIVMEVACEGPCFTKPIYRFLSKPETGELTYLEEMSTQWAANYLEPLMAVKSSMIINEIRTPERIEIPGGENRGVFTRDAVDLGANSLEGRDILFEDSVVGAIYKDENTGCLFAKAPDGTVSRYVYDPGFDGENSHVYFDAKAISLNNYTFTRGGCGIVGGCYLIEDEISEDELNQVGETDGGIKIYETKNPTIEAHIPNKAAPDWATVSQTRLASTYNMYVKLVTSTLGFGIEPALTYDKEAQAPISFEAFVATHPVLYWQDPLGNWASLIHTDFQPPAECGKPVIYLYPEETMDVSVEVEVDEFTVTIPEHGDNGWTVRAEPDGTLYNYADGETYPYLFWEGHDEDKIKVSDGFMVARRDVPRFLHRSLTQLGFTRQEKKDFIEFWQPVMLDNPEPYFYVSFVGTHEFNAVAPLHVSPAPDTLIRVFMYFDPVLAPYSVRPQELNAVPRRGFTLFEWGGTSSRPWLHAQ